MNTTIFLTPPRIARMVGVGADKVSAWIAAGELKATNVSQSSRPRWKVHPDDLQRFLDGRSNQAPAKSRRRRRDIPTATKSYV